jgi:hypothetical protein
VSNSLGVIIPVLNCRARLERHLGSVRAWIDLADQVVVVDSFSTDGSWEYLRQNLRHPRISFYQQPPGLWDCWNFALRNLQTEFAYISTAGDRISRDGLADLLVTARNLSCDLLASRPRFLLENGREIERRWPLHDYLSRMEISNPGRVEPMHAFLCGVLEIPEGFFGSAASNILRVAAFQRFPFPANYGHLGDSAWVIKHAFDVTIGVTPGVVSEFLIHPNAGQMDEQEKMRFLESLTELARRTLALQSGIPGASELSLGLAELLELRKTLRERQLVLDRCKGNGWPIFNPGVWRARANRNGQRKELSLLKDSWRRRYGLLGKDVG